MPSMEWDDIAKLFGYENGERIRQEFKRERKKLGMMPSLTGALGKRKVTIDKDGNRTIEIEENIGSSKLKTAEDIIRENELNPDDWEVLTFTHTSWDGFDGERKFAAKVQLKPRTKHNGMSRKDIVAIFDELSKTVEHKKYTPSQYEYGGEMLEIDLFDVHFSKLACAIEVGENYDFKIAKERILKSVKAYVERLKGRKFEKILLPIGNDFFNNTTADGATIHGTPQDNDLRWSKMFVKGVETLVEVVDMLANIAPVEVIFVPGNHDLTVSFYAVMYLSAWYRNTEGVAIDVSPMTRKYTQFGVSAIGFTHGDQDKKRIFGLMQIEAPQIWANTKYREWHIGHWHRVVTEEEESGVLIRTMPSITATDAYHYQSGFVGAIQRCSAFVWDKSKGLTEIHYVNM